MIAFHFKATLYISSSYEIRISEMYYYIFINLINIDYPQRVIAIEFSSIKYQEQSKLERNLQCRCRNYTYTQEIMEIV